MGDIFEGRERSELKGRGEGTYSREWREVKLKGRKGSTEVWKYEERE